MDDWLIWLIFAAVLIVAETLTFTAALGILAAAAVITAVLAAIGLPLPIQLLAFSLAATAGLILIRPAAQRRMIQPPQQRFGIDALVGKPAHVLHQITASNGQIGIGGKEWTARPYDDTLTIPAGSTVYIMDISGTIARVYPRETLWASPPS